MGARADRGGGPRACKFSAEVLEGLIVHAKHERLLSARKQDGSTERDNLIAAAAQGSLAAEQALAGPGLPEEAAYLWEWFGELNAARGSNGFAPEPISFTEIAAWAGLTARRLAPWEVRWLKILDRVWLAEPERAGQ